MQMALDLAEKARGATSPNPLVGCVIVSPDGHVVGKGIITRPVSPMPKSMPWTTQARRLQALRLM